MELETVILRGFIQTEKGKHCMFSLIWEWLRYMCSKQPQRLGS